MLGIRAMILIGVFALMPAKVALAERNPELPPPEVVSELGPNYQLLHQMSFAKDSPSEAVADVAHEYDVTKYILDIELSPAEPFNKVKGHATIMAQSQVPNLNTLNLDLVGLKVDSCKIDSKLTSFTRIENKLHLVLDRAYSVGQSFIAEVFYRGYPLAGLYLTTNKYNQPVYFTHNEPDRSKYWFPCYDFPSDKAQAEVICTVPVGLEVISNGSLIRVTQNSDNTVTYHWQENYPIATYLISVAVCDYAHNRDFVRLGADEIPLSYWVYPQDSAKALYDFDRVPEMVTLFSDLFGDYPFRTEKFSIAQASLSGAMENQTCVSWGLNIEGNYANEWIVAHELAHHWWGNMVGLSDFGNNWLKEGLATYCEALWKEHYYGDYRFKGHMAGLEYWVITDSSGSVSYPIYDPPAEYLFGKAVYRKGAWVMHMLRKVIGDQEFFAGLRSYAQAYAYSTAHTEEFKNIKEIASGQDLDWFFNQWVYSPNFPKYKWSWVYTSLQGKYYMDISIHQTQVTPLFYKMPVDFELTNATGNSRLPLYNSSRYQDYSFIMDVQPIGLVFDPDNWLLGVQSYSSYPAVPGDVNQDGQVRFSDVIYLVNLILKNGPRPSPAALADVDGNCRVTVADIIYFTNFITKNGPELKIGCP